MKNPETKTKIRAVLKAALWGGLIFAAVTIIAILSAPIFGLFPYLLVGIPKIQLEILFTGKMSVYGSGFSEIFLRIVTNGILGALICGGFSAFRHFLKKDTHEK